jgi:hypothetical protein
MMILLMPNTWTVNDANDATSATSPADIDIEINSTLMLFAI